MKFWQSSICLHVEEIDASTDFVVGYELPCCACEDPDCIAKVQQNTPIVDIVGHSPEHEYEKK